MYLKLINIEQIKILFTLFTKLEVSWPKRSIPFTPLDPRQRPFSTSIVKIIVIISIMIYFLLMCTNVKSI